MGTASETVQEAALRLGRAPAASFDRLVPKRPPPQAPATTAPGNSLIRIIVALCAALAVLTGVILLCVHLVGAEIARAGHSVDTSVRQIVIGNDVVFVPANMIRFRSQRRASTLERLDLYLLWPEMAGYSEAGKGEFNRAVVNPDMLFLTLEPRSMSQDMSGRIEPIYSKFLSGPAVDAGNGLMRRALSAEGGFNGEELWYEANSPYPFAARCVRPDELSATPYCLRDIHMGQDLSVTYRFHQSLIGEWMALDSAVRAQVKRMLAVQ
jgi:hypothetical protein